MVEFSLPKNSKVKNGKFHPSKEKAVSPKKLVIYRWEMFFK